MSDPTSITRRKLLTATATTAAIGITGCLNNDSSTDTESDIQRTINDTSPDPELDDSTTTSNIEELTINNAEPVQDGFELTITNTGNQDIDLYKYDITATLYDTTGEEIRTFSSIHIITGRNVTAGEQTRILFNTVETPGEIGRFDVTISCRERAAAYCNS